MGGVCGSDSVAEGGEWQVLENAKQLSGQFEEEKVSDVSKQQTSKEIPQSQRGRLRRRATVEVEFDHMDADGDGIITAEEFHKNFNSVLNPFLENIWPTLSRALSNIIKDNIQAGINAASRKFPLIDGHLHIDAVGLGEDPPRVGSAETYSMTKDGHTSVQIDLRLVWEPKIELKVELGPTSLGISSISFDGQASVMFTPLQEELPVIGGLHIFFLNAPDIVPKFTGLGGIASWHQVEDHTQHAIRKLLSHVMVLPNRLAIKFPSTTIADMAEFNRPPPQGVLEMDVLEARGLPKTTSFVVWVSLGHCDHHTKRAHGSAPSWRGELPRFLVDNEQQALRLELREENCLWHEEHVAQMPRGCNVVNLISAFHAELPKRGKDLQLGSWHKMNWRGRDRLEAEVRLSAHYYELRRWGKTARNNDADHESLTHRCKENTLVVLAAKVYLIRGAKFDQLNGSQIRLQVNGADTSNNVMDVGQIQAEHALGVPQFTIELVWKMHTQAKLSTEIIASLVSERVEIVEAIISAVRQEDGDLMLCGCNSVIYATVTDPHKAIARLHLGLKKQWVQIGDDLHVSDLLQGGGKYAMNVWRCVHKTVDADRKGLLHTAKETLGVGRSKKDAELEVEVAWEVYAAIPVAHEQAIQLWSH